MQFWHSIFDILHLLFCIPFYNFNIFCTTPNISVILNIENYFIQVKAIRNELLISKSCLCVFGIRPAVICCICIFCFCNTTERLSSNEEASERGWQRVQSTCIITCLFQYIGKGIRCNNSIGRNPVRTTSVTIYDIQINWWILNLCHILFNFFNLVCIIIY